MVKRNETIKVTAETKKFFEKRALGDGYNLEDFMELIAKYDLIVLTPSAKILFKMLNGVKKC